MYSKDSNTQRACNALSDSTLRSIVDDGFFGGPGTLSDARSACAELIFARAIIEAQTAKLLLLERARGSN